LDATGTSDALRRLCSSNADTPLAHAKQAATQHRQSINRLSRRRSLYNAVERFADAEF
jgi:ABC-type tungstate transport system permease subunit